MSEWFEEGGYDQQVKDSGEITCTCMWTTMEMGRYPKDWKSRRLCKHIKAVKVKIENDKTRRK